MFIAGLEGNLQMLMKYWKTSVTIAILGVIVQQEVQHFMCISICFSWETALFVGLVLSATSVNITVQVLREMNRMNSRERP